MPSPWHCRLATPSSALTSASHEVTGKAMGLSWSSYPAIRGDSFVLSQLAESETRGGGEGETPPQHPQPPHPQSRARGDHLCVSQLLRVLSHPGELKTRWQLWLWVAADSLVDC